jgi:hypothetical protein
MTLTMSRRDLDVWARALGVENDDDATAVMGPWLDRLEVATRELGSLHRVMSKVPANFDLGRIRKAHALTDDTLVDLARVLSAFYRHERGGV